MSVQHQSSQPQAPTPHAPTRGARARDALRRPAFWNIGGLFFFYFAIWQLVMTFLSLWLEQEAGMTSGNIGLVFSVIALVAFCLQPPYGYIQDRLGLRKHLFAFVVVCGALMGPFFAFVFLPIVGVNQVLGAVVAGAFLALVLNAGVSVVEAFNERTSRANGFEYGHVRLFGSLAGATASLVGGFVWASDPDNIWWAATFSAIVLGALLLVVRTPKPGDPGYAAVSADRDTATTENTTGSTAGTAAEASGSQALRTLLKDRSFVGFMVLMFGTAALYDVFDQQFPNYFADHATAVADPEVFFSRVVFVQILLEAAVMVVMPFVINRIGARWGLIAFAAVLVVRVLGTAFITSTEMLVVWRLLAALEMPLMLVSVMKYVTRMFDVKFSATAYMIGFSMSKAAGVFVFSWLFGLSYDAIGYAHSYLIMGGVVIAVTLVASFLMRDDRGRVAPGAGDLTPAGR
ncbi:OHS family lactose permease-like MFS transporter [Isoptericola sp. CG 20/1183]|uniref:OHS family lactose permease-like MFS transporter n=1 Tax=Isoptericola halotolerans TaxID=300560 RepID=A0ABX5EJQ4_9MICO|nr:MULTISPECIES: oligosaccharide MFS transporter [Isoptericola]PRZ09525.1 OHS family lactose permease-like MFS transporter [Isoptericola sp. CG 20/1183]PRZ10326.1 OHS family lactose permease-like MFS transporter [Isoptericola halotolerans]